MEAVVALVVVASFAVDRLARHVGAAAWAQVGRHGDLGHLQERVRRRLVDVHRGVGLQRGVVKG